jgi:hypothetical protein
MIEEITIESVDRSNCFGKFLSLGFGSSVLFERMDCSFIRSLCIELEATEVDENIVVKKAEELNEGNVIESLKYGEMIGILCEFEM